jgi:hypothetical protein
VILGHGYVLHPYASGSHVSGTHVLFRERGRATNCLGADYVTRKHPGHGLKQK